MLPLFSGCLLFLFQAASFLAYWLFRVLNRRHRRRRRRPDDDLILSGSLPHPPNRPLLAAPARCRRNLICETICVLPKLRLPHCCRFSLGEKARPSRRVLFARQMEK